MHFLEEAKKWLGEFTEIILLLIALGVGVEILFGKTVPFFGGIGQEQGIVYNLTTLLNTLGENGLVGLIALGIIVWLFYRKRPVTQQG
jgi:hypothetical protein